HGGGTHQHRPVLFCQTYYFIYDGIELLADTSEHQVVMIFSRDNPIGGDNHNIELVDIPEFPCLRFSRSGHTCQLVIHAEVVLQGDGGVGLCGVLNFDVFLCLDSLVQAVGVSSALHNTTGL